MIGGDSLPERPGGDLKLIILRIESVMANRFALSRFSKISVASGCRYLGCGYRDSACRGRGSLRTRSRSDAPSPGRQERRRRVASAGSHTGDTMQRLVHLTGPSVLLLQ